MLISPRHISGVDLEAQSLQTEDIMEKIDETIQELCTSNPNFEHAYDTYTKQYGAEIVVANDPVKLSGTIDPALLIFGRNCAVYYYDSRKELRGSDQGIELVDGTVCIVGRRQPQDSKLVAWVGGRNLEVELGEYNPQVGIIPSRVHGAIVVTNDGDVNYTDLCSSSGTIVVGDLVKGGPFVRIYDPGTPNMQAVRFERVSMSRKS